MKGTRKTTLIRDSLNECEREYLFLDGKEVDSGDREDEFADDMEGSNLDEKEYLSSGDDS